MKMQVLDNEIKNAFKQKKKPEILAFLEI